MKAPHDTAEPGHVPRTTPEATPGPPTSDEVIRVVLRPIATPLPLGFLALAVATTAFASVQLGWISPTQSHPVALGVLALTVPLQLLAAIMGFLARDPVAATGMGILFGTWGAVGLVTLTSPPGAASDGLGVILLASAACLLVPAAAARSKLVPALVILTSATRFALTGIAEINVPHQRVLLLLKSRAPEPNFDRLATDVNPSTASRSCAHLATSGRTARRLDRRRSTLPCLTEDGARFMGGLIPTEGEAACS